MKNIKKYHIAVFLLGLISTVSCSEDIDLWQMDTEVKEGYLKVNIVIPEAEIVATRATSPDLVAERKLDTLDFLFFGTDGKLKYHVQKSVVSGMVNDDYGDYATTVEFEAPKNKVSDGDKLYVIANYSELSLEEGITTLDDIKDITETSLLASSPNFVMSGNLNPVSLTSINEIEIDRIAAKVSVSSSSPVSATLESVRNTANSGYVLAPTLGTKYVETDEYINKREPQILEGGSNPNFLYVYPTKPGKAFMILECPFEYKKYYYKVEFVDESKSPLTISPNHWYEVSISEVKAMGYTDPEEAAKNPAANGIVADIHDHAPDVYSMVSDGSRELGVKKSIVHSNTDTEIKYLSVRLYSENKSEYTSISMNSVNPSNIVLMTEEKDIDESKLTIDFSEIKNWCTVSAWEEGTGLENNYSSDTGETTADKGKTLKFKLAFNDDNLSDISDLSGKIYVYWQGLKREVDVLWQRDFSANAISSVSLRIHPDAGEVISIKDYWTFLSGDGTLTSKESDQENDAPKLYGVNSKDMPDTKTRNQGFHFPVMYGETSPWWYEYEVQLNNISTPTECKFEVSGDAIVKYGLKIKIGNDTRDLNSNQVITLNDGNFILYRESQTDDYEYGIGVLKISVGENITYEFDLYHTGFFHYEGELDTRLDEPDPAYYYYEVVKLEGSDGYSTYWLDRNLGATSSGLYIQDSEGGSLLSGSQWPYHDGSKGGYYKMDERVCPLGYRIPLRAEWDNIRLSSKFHNEARISESHVTYYTSYFSAAGYGEVVFPKSRYINSSTQTMGDPYAGYYWSSTESLGVTELNRWYMALNLNGASSYWVTGDATDYGMSIRCVSKRGGDIPVTNHSISFNVTGATHVYLYKYDSQGNREGVFPWPGKTIGNACSMSIGGVGKGYPNPNDKSIDQWGNYTGGWFYRQKMAHFAYDTTMDPKKLYVLFNFVTDEGKIFTYCSNNQTAVSNEIYPAGSSSINPKDAKGWKVLNDNNTQSVAYLFQFDLDTDTGIVLHEYTYVPRDGDTFDTANKNFTNCATFDNRDNNE